MENEKYLVIIGDIIQSRKISNRKIFQEHFANQFKNMDNVEKYKIVSPFTVTIGDEFQGVLKNAENIFKIIDTFEYGLNSALTEKQSEENTAVIKQASRFRYGFGIGEISTHINSGSAIGMDGPAFYNARASIEQAKKENLKFCFRSDSPDDETINLLLGWLGHEVRKWGWKKFQIIKLKKDGWTQKQIAENLRISQPAVSKALKSAPINLLVQTEKIIEEQLSSKLREQKAVTYSMVAEPSYKYNPGPR